MGAVGRWLCDIANLRILDSALGQDWPRISSWVVAESMRPFLEIRHRSSSLAWTTTSQASCTMSRSWFWY